MTMASNDMKYEKLSEEVSRERHMKNISPLQSIYPDTSTWTFFSYNNEYIICYTQGLSNQYGCSLILHRYVMTGTVQHSLMYPSSESTSIPQA